MQLHSRSRTAGAIQRPPLTDDQKSAIRTLSHAGRSACQIADELGIGEGQVQYWRAAYGIRFETPQNVGRNGGRRPSSPLKPRHVKGEIGNAEWFESCDAAFHAAMTAELEIRDQEKAGLINGLVG